MRWRTARVAGLASAGFLLCLEAAYAIALWLGLRALPSPDTPITWPYFPVLEGLILLIAPALVVLMAAVHGITRPQHRSHSRLALTFIILMAIVTFCLHLTLLLIGPEGQARHPTLLAFRWPSIAYAVDIVAWDGLFALAVLFGAQALQGHGIKAITRWLLRISGILALAGLISVPFGDMQLRMIGIIGYAGIFPLATAGLLAVFRREKT